MEFWNTNTINVSSHSSNTPVLQSSSTPVPYFAESPPTYHPSFEMYFALLYKNNPFDLTIIICL